MMNYFVHSIMYSYYGITALGYRLPKIISMSVLKLNSFPTVISRTVTALQTTQMLIGVAISVIVLGLKLNGQVIPFHFLFYGSLQLCQQSYDNLAICFAIYASFLILFSSFFNKAYLVKRAPKEEKKEVKQE